MTTAGSRSPLVVVGDAMLDIDLTGSVSRLCPDEPAPVVESIDESARPGGAGLAALIAAQSDPVVLVTAIARDAAGERLAEMLESRMTVINLGADSTVVKTRVRVADRTLLRMDQSTSAGYPLRAAHPDLDDVLAEAAAVLVSDYGLGVTSHARIRSALGVAPLVWDPHPRGARPVPGVTTVTPNVREAQHFSGDAGTDLPSSIRQGKDLTKKWRARSVTVTLGNRGAVVCAPRRTALVVPAQRNVAGDTCGAGDACAAGIAVGLAQGQDIADAVRTGVDGAADFLGRGGAAKALDDPGAGQSESRGTLAEGMASAVRERGGTVVLAGGCFDLLHAGHVKYLRSARALGDCLIVALNSDSSVRHLKGSQRPLVPQEDRATILQALDCVNAVEIFEEHTATEVVRRLKPHIFAKGGDYREDAIPEARVVREHGGEVVVLPTLQGRSTTLLVESARAGTGAIEEEDEQCQTQPA